MIGTAPWTKRGKRFSCVQEPWLTLPLSWIYAQFIALDANFRLKLKNRQINDPELGSGWFYFVENSAYTRHVQQNLHEEEVRCVPNGGNMF